MAVGWEQQPRDAETGRWILRRGQIRRSRTIKIRLTAKEEENIRSIADAAGMTITRYIIGCCSERQRIKPAFAEKPAHPEPPSMADEFARHRAALVRRNRRRR